MIEFPVSTVSTVNEVQAAPESQVETLHFSGFITSETAPPLVAQVLAGHVRTLVITSGGGDPEAAIAVGDVLNKSDVTVRVKRYCLSSCAMFIALPAAELIIEADSVLGFHHSQAALMEAFTTSFPQASLDWERLSRVSEAQNDAFDRWGLPKWWLTSPMTSIGASCLRERFGTGQFSTPRYLSTHTFWMPKLSDIPNLRSGGDLPNDPQLLTKYGLTATVTYGGEHHTEPLALPKCDPA